MQYDTKNETQTGQNSIQPLWKNPIWGPCLIGRIVLGIVDPEKEDTYQEGLFTGLNLKKILAAISTQGPLLQTALQGERCTELPDSFTELPAYTVFLPSEPALIEFLELYFNQ